MPPEEAKLTLLACTQCGAKLELEEAELNKFFLAVSETSFIFTGSAQSEETYVCKHCGHTYVRGDKSDRHTGDVTNIVATNGSTVVNFKAASVNNAHIVIGNNNRVG